MSLSTGTTYRASVLIFRVSHAGEGPWEASFSEEFGHQPHFVTAPRAAMKWQQEHPQTPVRHNSTQRRRINPNGLLKSFAKRLSQQEDDTAANCPIWLSKLIMDLGYSFPELRGCGVCQQLSRSKSDTHYPSINVISLSSQQIISSFVIFQVSKKN